MAGKRESSQKPQEPEAVRAARIAGKYAIAAAIVSAVVTAALTNGFGLLHASSSGPTANSYAESRCSSPGGTSGVVQPSPKISNSLVFCPVLINGGSLPVTGPYEVSGQVLGPLSERKSLVLIKYFNPRTCDALGNPPAPGGYFESQVNLASPDGFWSYTDEPGYPEAITLGVKLEYVSASSQSIQLMRNNQANWQASGGNPHKYPGILALPGDAAVLATFDVPPGVFHGHAGPCD